MYFVLNLLLHFFKNNINLMGMYYAIFIIPIRYKMFHTSYNVPINYQGSLTA